MRFHVEVLEAETNNRQEEVAIINHRINSMKYYQNLFRNKEVELVFKSEDLCSTFLVLNVESLEEADRILKADPLFIYSRMNVTPVTTTAEMVEEAQDYLGEQVLTPGEIAHLVPPPVEIVDDESYIYATKMLAPFNTLTNEEDYKEILRKTLRSQRLHADEKEIADYNPVGIPDGYLYLKIPSIADARKHVEKAEIYPHTVVNFQKIYTLKQALDLSLDHLKDLGEKPETTVSL